MKHEDKKHFDVSKPRRRGPDPTSKPIIVGHHPMMPDPMIKEEREKVPKPITVVSDGDEAEPLKVTKSGSVAGDLGVKPDDKPEAKPTEEPLETKLETPPEPVSEPPAVSPEIPPEAVPGAIFHPPEKTAEADASTTEPMAEPKTDAPEIAGTDPTVPAAIAGTAVAASAADASAEASPATELPQPAPNEPPAGQELHIPAGHGHTAVHHKPRIWVWVVIGIIILIWIYAAVDALTNTKLPLEFFENSGQTAQPVTNTPVQTAPAQTTPPPVVSSAFVLPDGWTWYENKDLGFKFAYPGEWGTLTKASTEGNKTLNSNLNAKTLDDVIDYYHEQLQLQIYNSKLTIITEKYGPTLQPTKNGSEIIWHVSDTNGDAQYKAGQAFNVPIAKKLTESNVYEFASGDEGCQFTSFVFAVSSNYAEIYLPSICPKDLGGPIPKSITAPYATTKQKIIESITFSK